MGLSAAYKSKYEQSTITKVLELLKSDLQIREIAKRTGVPETTIRNWKFSYSNLRKTNRKLDAGLKKQTMALLNKEYSVPEIAKKIKVNYNSVRLFVKKRLSEKEYSLMRAINKGLPDKSRALTPEFAYILGVMYGDGYFGRGQIRLGAKDKEFVDYFANIVEQWCYKKPARAERVRNNKPYYECYLSFKEATDFVLDVVKDRMTLPKILLWSNNTDVVSMFIKGFSDSEGTFIVQKGATLKIYNQKKQVLYELKRLFLKLGFDEKKVYVVFNNKAKNGDIYAIRICYKDQLKLFYEKIGFTIQRKQQKLEKYITLKSQA